MTFLRECGGIVSQDTAVQFLGRWIWVAFSLAIAGAVAMLFLPIATAVDPVLRKIAFSMRPEDLNGLIVLLFDPEAFAGLAIGALAFLWAAMLVICFVPVTIAGVLGEAVATRSLAWYAGASGLLAGAMPWIVRAARDARPRNDSLIQTIELRFALIFFLTGMAAGVIYWLAAGRNTGRMVRSG